jgi:hypothetical protein
VHIPALNVMAGPYEVIAGTGRYAYFVTVALSLVCLPVLVHASWKAGGGPARATAGALVMFAGVGTAGRAGIGGALAIDSATVATVAVGAGAAIASFSGMSRLPVALFAMAFVLSGGHTAMQAVAQAGAGSADTRWLLTIAEVAGVAFALASLLLARPSGRAAKTVGLCVGVLTFGMLLGNGSTFRILLLWNEGLSGTLPAAAYAAGAGALAMTFVSLLKRNEALTAIGLLLVLAGGFGLHNTYQTGLVMMGLAVLTLAAATGMRVTALQPAAKAGTVSMAVGD